MQPDGNSTVHRWIQGAEQAKSRWTVNFQKLCDFQYLPDVENRRKNERTVSYCLGTPLLIGERKGDASALLLLIEGIYRLPFSMKLTLQLQLLPTPAEFKRLGIPLPSEGKPQEHD